MKTPTSADTPLRVSEEEEEEEPREEARKKREKKRVAKFGEDPEEDSNYQRSDEGSIGKGLDQEMERWIDLDPKVQEQEAEL